MVLLLSTLRSLQITYFINREAENSICKVPLLLPKSEITISNEEVVKSRVAEKSVKVESVSLKGSAELNLGIDTQNTALNSKDIPQYIQLTPPYSAEISTGSSSVALSDLQGFQSSVEFKQSIVAFADKVSRLSQKSIYMCNKLNGASDYFDNEVNSLLRKTAKGRTDSGQLKCSIDDQLEDLAGLMGCTQDVMRQTFEGRVILEDSSSNKSYFKQYKVLSTLPPILVEKKEFLDKSLQEVREKLNRLQELLIRAESIKSVSKDRLYMELRDTSSRTQSIAEKISSLEKSIEDIYHLRGKPMRSRKKSLSTELIQRSNLRINTQRRWGLLLSSARTLRAPKLPCSSEENKNVLTTRLNHRWTHVKSFITTAAAVTISQNTVPSRAVGDVKDGHLGSDALALSIRNNDEKKVNTLASLDSNDVRENSGQLFAPYRSTEDYRSSPNVFEDNSRKYKKAPVSSFTFAANLDAKTFDLKTPAPPVPGTAPSSFGFGVKPVEKAKDTKAPAPAPPVSGTAPSSFTFTAKPEEKAKDTKAPAPPVPGTAPSSSSFDGSVSDSLSEKKAPDATSSLSFPTMSEGLNQISDSLSAAGKSSALSGLNSQETIMTSSAGWGTAPTKGLFKSPSSYSGPGASVQAQTPVLGNSASSSLFKPTSNSPFSASVLANASTNTTSFEDKVKSFYAKYNPLKIEEVSGLVLKYHGREQELFDKLEKKYNVQFFSKPPIFGNNMAQTQGSGFGGVTTTTSVFGQNSQRSSSEGTASPFSASLSASTPFAQSSGRSLFSTPPISVPAFGQPSALGNASSPSVLSQQGISFGGSNSFEQPPSHAQTSSFGQNLSFGQTSSFGQASSGFKAPTNAQSGSPFARADPKFGQVTFGQPQTTTITSGFGQGAATAPRFGQSSTPPYNQPGLGTGTLFGKPTQPLFGQSSFQGSTSNLLFKSTEETEMAMSDDQPSQGQSGSSLFGGGFQSQSFRTFR